MLLLIIIVAQEAVFRFHKLFVPPQSGGMGASAKRPRNGFSCQPI